MTDEILGALRERMLFHLERQIIEQEAKLFGQVFLLREALEGFLTKGQSLGASHPHFANFLSFPSEVWDMAQAAMEHSK